MSNKIKKIAMLFIVSLTIFWANASRTIVIKSGNSQEGGKTEVSINNDTITITPSNNTSIIEISIADIERNTMAQETVPTTVEKTFSLPDLPESYLLEIRDNKGVIYQEFTNKEYIR